MNEPLEIEVKYLVTDVPSIRRQIVEAGAESLGRFFETNIRFEDEENSLKPQKKLLRLRQDRKATLTFKSEIPNIDSRYKILKELEVQVESFDTMRIILTSLGFHEAQVYEKWRETFRAGNALICIDEMPYADFIEIEGSTTDIDNLSKTLGFSPTQIITANYLEIFAYMKHMENLGFNDVTFDHFKTCPTRRETLISHARTFESGITSSSPRSL